MNTIKTRKHTLSIGLWTLVLLGAVFSGVVNAGNVHSTVAVKANLANVRTYTPASTPQQVSYANDGGVLFAGGPQGWTAVQTPNQIIVGAVAVDRNRPQTLYVGAANEMALYRSLDAGQHWLRVPLNTAGAGGVTALAVDSSQQLVYVGTDNAGVFRLRDVGPSMILSGQQMLDAPVLQVAADSTGAGLAFVRTQTQLYRAENGGLTWAQVTNLKSVPTALVITNGQPATVYVGTADRGLLSSHNGQTWTLTNSGSGLTPGARLQVDALAADPAQPNVLYVASSYLYGSTQVYQSPLGVAMSTDGAQSWLMLRTNDNNTPVADLFPVTGVTGAVYALTTQSRTPLALGKAALLAAKAPQTAVTATNVYAFDTEIASWVVAALAALGLLFALVNDLRGRRPILGKTTAVALR